MSKPSLSLAYNMSKRSKPKGYAKGGIVKPDASESEIMKDRKIGQSADIEGDDEMFDAREPSEPAELKGNNFEGEGSEAEQPEDDNHPMSENEDIVDAIMAKRRFAAGGMVEKNAGETDSVFAPEDRFSDHGQESNLKENYASDLDDEDKDTDLIGSILKDRKNKKR